MSATVRAASLAMAGLIIRFSQEEVLAVAAQIILFRHANFHGAHKHVFDREPNLDLVVRNEHGQAVRNIDGDFSRSVSSLAILSGNWTFFSEVEFGGKPFPPVLG